MFKKKGELRKEESKEQKLFDKLKIKNRMTEKDKKTINIAFNALAIFCIAIFCMSITPKTLQNDTYYTIKIGQLIRENGIDYKDHFSWHENLEYLYPHWLYDLVSSLIYDFCGGFLGIYIATMILSVLLGISIYYTNKKICKDATVSFAMTIGQMYLLRSYVAARAQLVTFILFVLTVFFIEKFLDNPKKRYAAALIIIPILISNFHSAVFPFYFVLYMPYVGEYLIRVLMDWHLPHKLYQIYINKMIEKTNKKLKKVEKNKAPEYQVKLANYNKKIEQSNSNFEKFITKQNSRRSNPDKVRIERNDNTLKLIIIMFICLFTGLLSPLKDMPYTYTWRIMKGNTTKNVSEHIPIVLIENKPILISLASTLALLIFTKVKIRLRDLFFIFGLTLLTLMTRRQASMLAIFGGFALARMIMEILNYYDKKGLSDLLKYLTSVSGEILTIILVFSISYTQYKPKMRNEFVSESSYPVQACEWIKENLDYKNIKMYNEYNFGSYLLFEDIPVFIDSRCDLYTPEFNGEYDKEKKKFEGQDIFSDFININSIGTYYDDKFKEYEITHVITKTNSKLNMLLSRDDKYEEKYKDEHFIIYERLNKKEETESMT